MGISATWSRIGKQLARWLGRQPVRGEVMPAASSVLTEEQANARFHESMTSSSRFFILERIGR